MKEIKQNDVETSKLEAAMEQAEAVMQFPMLFPIKVMGLASENFVALVEAIARLHFQDFNERLTKIEHSRTGKYVSVTVTVNAQSKEQLDAIYMDYTSRPEVKIVL